MIPGRLRSTINCDIPSWRAACFSPVRTRAIMKCECWALVVHTFCPLSSQPASLRRAVVLIDARSEPEFGSLMPMQK
ncbi:hypothetical protein D3C80_1679400 [compost metagenome]